MTTPHMCGVLDHVTRTYDRECVRSDQMDVEACARLKPVVDVIRAERLDIDCPCEPPNLHAVQASGWYQSVVGMSLQTTARSPRCRDPTMSDSKD